ncbi:MAG: hypothetical protein ACI38A_08990 [Candidatus Ornithomonoglobus sp.]
MEDKEFRKAYKELFDGIKAGNELKARVLAGKRRKYDARPVIAAISTIAAAVAVFAAVRGYDFSHRDDGTITETAVTETAPPRKGISEPFEQNEEEIGEQTEESAEKPDAVTETSEHEKKPASTPDAAKKTTEDYMREAVEGMNTAAPFKAQSAAEKTQTAPPAASAPRESVSSEQQTVPQETDEYTNETDGEQEVSAAQPRIMKQSSYEEASVQGASSSEDTGESLVIPFPTGPVILRMNSQSVLAEFMYEVVPTAENEETKEEYHTEKWDNRMYFDYLGIDIINGLKLSDDMKYSGDDVYYFAVDANGRLKNDTRIFTFEGSEGRLVSVLTSRDTTFVDSILSSPEVMKSRISDIQVAAFQPDQAYYFYMKSNDVAYIITTEELDGQEIADLLFSIDTER